MNLNYLTLAAIANRLKQYLEYKQFKTVRKYELKNYLTTVAIDNNVSTLRAHPRMEARIGSIFVTISNLLESGVMDMDTYMMLLFDYYIRTGKPMRYNTNMSMEELRERLRFLSVLDVNRQLDLLEAIQGDIRNQTKLSKFTGKKVTLFGVKEDQKNELYGLVKKGKISYLLFLFYWKNSKFQIDDSKITDLDYLKFIQLIKYAEYKDLKTEKTKYEV